MKTIRLELPQAVIDYAAPDRLGELLSRAVFEDARDRGDDRALLLALAAVNYGEDIEELFAKENTPERDERDEATIH